MGKRVAVGEAGGKGRMERAVDAAVRAGRDGGPADARWAACETLARMLGAALDLTRAEPYAQAQLAPRMIEVLRELRLTPEARPDAGGDELATLLAALSAPPVLDET